MCRAELGQRRRAANRASQKCFAPDGRKAQKKYTSEGRKGEGDRFIGTKMPRHLFSGKRGVGKTDRR